MKVNTEDFKPNQKPNRARRRQLAKIAKKNPNLFTQFMNNNPVFKPNEEGMNKLSAEEQASVKEQMEEQGIKMVNEAENEDVGLATEERHALIAELPTKGPGIDIIIDEPSPEVSKEKIPHAAKKEEAVVATTEGEG